VSTVQFIRGCVIIAESDINEVCYSAFIRRFCCSELLLVAVKM